jgi:CubicO group peptidase (beta-lactamase class C family)
VSASEAAKSPRRPLETLADYIPRLANVPLAFQPGSRWAYSPLAAFDTLGRIVEIVSGQHFDAFLEQHIFAPLGMKDTCFELPQDRIPRLVTLLDKTPQGLEKYSNQNLLIDKHYFSGGGGLMSTAEDYLQFAQMLLEGGQLNGKRVLSPKTIELMTTPHVPDSVAGRMPGRAFGLSVQIVTDPIAASFRVSPGSYGWDGAFGTHFWVDPKEKVVGILMVQTRTPNREADRDVESAVMQALID